MMPEFKTERRVYSWVTCDQHFWWRPYPVSCLSSLVTYNNDLKPHSHRPATELNGISPTVVMLYIGATTAGNLEETTQERGKCRFPSLISSSFPFFMSSLFDPTPLLRSLGPFHGAIAVPSVTRCCRRRCCCRGHRCAGGVTSDTW